MKNKLLSLLLYCLCGSSLAQEKVIEIPGIGKIPIGGKLGKLLGKPAADPASAASSPAAPVGTGSYSTTAPVSGKGVSVVDKKGIQITKEDALRCHTSYNIGQIARMRNPEDKRTASFPTGSSHPLWDLIIATTPELRNLPPQEAEYPMTRIRDKDISNNLDMYLSNIDLLVAHWNACVERGIKY